MFHEWPSGAVLTYMVIDRPAVVCVFACLRVRDWCVCLHLLRAKVVSLVALFVNKHVLSSMHMPAIVEMLCQAAFTAAVSATQCKRLRVDHLFASIPAALAFGLSLSFSNYCLQIVPVYCFQVARAMTVAISFVSATLLGERFALGAVVGVGLVVVGFVSAVYDPTETCSRSGFVVGTIGSAFTVAYTFAAQRLARALAAHDGGSAELMFHTNALVVVGALPVALLQALAGDASNVALAWRSLASPRVSATLFGSCIASVGVNFASVNQIARTSPLTHTLSTTIKSLAQTMIDALWRAAPLAALASSSLLVVTGSTLYALSKQPVN